MWVISADLEILLRILVDRAGTPEQGQFRQRTRLASELLAGLVEMVRIEMAVAAGPDEGAGLEAALLGEHVGEQGVAGNVERHAEEHVGAALVELEVELA